MAPKKLPDGKILFRVCPCKLGIQQVDPSEFVSGFRDFASSINGWVGFILSVHEREQRRFPVITCKKDFPNLHSDCHGFFQFFSILLQMVDYHGDMNLEVGMDQWCQGFLRDFLFWHCTLFCWKVGWA